MYLFLLLEHDIFTSDQMYAIPNFSDKKTKTS